MTPYIPKGLKARLTLSPSRKVALITSAAGLVMMAAAPAAHAQDLDITANTTTPVVNPGSNSGLTINIAAGVNFTVADNDTNDGRPRNSNFSLDDGTDDIIINNAGSIISNDQTDEETAIFFDNSEDNLTINNLATGLIEGVDGAIYLEGDGANITNAGIIRGTGAADEGVIYIDREADSTCLLYTSPSPRDATLSRMPSSA